ncbi:hypothetical protein [Faecalimicrobium sp. JNUCC 81]
MGMYFTIADNIDCAFRKKKFAILDDDMDQLIFKNKDAFGSSVDVFIDLDPYGDKIFIYDEIELLLVASEALLKNDIIDYLDSKGEFKNYDVDKRRFIEFANSMILMCNSALESNSKIVSLGD